MKRIFRKFIEMCRPKARRDFKRNAVNVNIYKLSDKYHSELVASNDISDVFNELADYAEKIEELVVVEAHLLKSLSPGDRMKLVSFKYNSGEFDYVGLIFFMIPESTAITKVYEMFQDICPNARVRDVDVDFPSILCVSNIKMQEYETNI